MAFMIFKYVSSIPAFSRVFIKKVAEFCQRPFLHRLTGSYGSYLSFINVMYHVDSFVNVEPALHPRNESHLIMVNNSFYMPLNSIASILLRIFASIFIRDIGL